MVVGIRLGSNSKTTLLWHNSPWCFLKSWNNHITIFNEPLWLHRFDGLTHAASICSWPEALSKGFWSLPPATSAAAMPVACAVHFLAAGWVFFEWGFGHCLFASCVPTWSNCLFVLCQLFAGSSSIVFHQQLLFGLCFYSIPSSWDVSGAEISNATPPPQGQNISNSTFITLILRPNIGYTHLPP